MALRFWGRDRGRLIVLCLFFFFNDTATTEIYTLSLHDALPICWKMVPPLVLSHPGAKFSPTSRSEEHTSELQSRENLVCRLLLEKKKEINYYQSAPHKNKNDSLQLLFTDKE